MKFQIFLYIFQLCVCVCVCVFMIGELKEKKLSTRLSLVYVFTIVLVPIDIVHMYPCTVMEEVEGMMGIMFIILIQIITSAINWLLLFVGKEFQDVLKEVSVR